MTVRAPVTDAARSYKALINPFAKAKGSKSGKSDALARYTNLSLHAQWAPFDMQTQLLCREAVVPLMKGNPEMLAAEAAISCKNLKPNVDEKEQRI